MRNRWHFEVEVGHCGFRLRRTLDFAALDVRRIGTRSREVEIQVHVDRSRFFDARRRPQSVLASRVHGICGIQGKTHRGDLEPALAVAAGKFLEFAGVSSKRCLILAGGVDFEQFEMNDFALRLPRQSFLENRFRLGIAPV